ncbi:hypothetical protein Deima_1764 [Deinococcus maricopensis DSM 21211]|uniref:Uncharacterized protein n=2 Tax=Deinococcus TaxID=1298 RepID=E8U8M4_DEIML|nr:hypothetical protein Deima_1764 [Deinococcus maricopensis DSM 21211]
MMASVLMIGSASAHRLEALRDNVGNRLKLPVGDWGRYEGVQAKLRAGNFAAVQAYAQKPDLTLIEAGLVVYFAGSKGFAEGAYDARTSFLFTRAAADVYLDAQANLNMARLSQRGSDFGGLLKASPELTFLYLNRAWEAGSVLAEHPNGRAQWSLIVNASLGLADGFYAAGLNNEFPTQQTLRRLRPELLKFRAAFGALYGLQVPSAPTTVMERHYDY